MVKMLYFLYLVYVLKFEMNLSDIDLFSVWELMLALLIVLSKIVLVRQEQVAVLKWSMILNLTGEYYVLSSIIKKNALFTFFFLMIDRKSFTHFLCFYFIRLLFSFLFMFIFLLVQYVDYNLFCCNVACYCFFYRQCE